MEGENDIILQIQKRGRSLSAHGGSVHPRSARWEGGRSSDHLQTYRQKGSKNEGMITGPKKSHGKGKGLATDFPYWW